MTHKKLLLILLDVGFLLVYLLFSTNFKKGWIKKSIRIRNTKVSLLHFVLLAVALLILVILLPI
jgi:hypothetical protein